MSLFLDIEYDDDDDDTCLAMTNPNMMSVTTWCHTTSSAHTLRNSYNILH